MNITQNMTEASEDADPIDVGDRIRTQYGPVVERSHRRGVHSQRAAPVPSVSLFRFPDVAELHMSTDSPASASSFSLAVDAGHHNKFSA